MGSVTNEELLQEKEAASIMHCLGALQRFEDMSRAEIQKIVDEVAVIGADGIDYASSDQKYTLNPLRCAFRFHQIALSKVILG